MSRTGLASAALFGLGIAVVAVVAAHTPKQAAPTAGEVSGAMPSDSPAELATVAPRAPGFPLANYGPGSTEPDVPSQFPLPTDAPTAPSEAVSCPANGPLIDHYTLTNDRFGALTCCPTYVDVRYIPVAGPQCIAPGRRPGG